MIYAKEFFVQVIDEIKPLLEKHWEEIALNKEKVPLDPDYDRYLFLEKSGILDIYTARENGKLMGYCITFTMPHIHYMSTVMASVDILYVDPSRRGKMAGVLLMKFVEEKMKEKGVQVFTHHVKVEHDYSSILKRLGYVEVERIYNKYLGD